MLKIEITASQARENVEKGKKGLNEARAKLTSEIRTASLGLLSRCSIPINKIAITEDEARELCFELIDLGYGARVLDQESFHRFEVSWH